MITISQFEKVAFPLYDYTACSSRNYIPKPPPYPDKVVSNNSGKKVSIPKADRNDLPAWGKNVPSNAITTTFPYYHSFAPTVSGTGGGPQLWPEPKNPYDN